MLVVQTALNLPNNMRKNGHYGFLILRHISQKLKLEECLNILQILRRLLSAEKVLIARTL